MKQIGDRAHSTAITVPAALVSVMLGATAHSQQAPSSFADEGNRPELETVVVTGSMIKRVNAETAEAITVLESDALKDQASRIWSRHWPR